MLDIKHGRVDGERKRAAEGEAATVLGEPHPSASAKFSPVLPSVAATRALTGYMMAPEANSPPKQQEQLNAAAAESKIIKSPYSLLLAEN